MTPQRVEATIKARVKLRYEPWRMYGPAVGGPLRFTKGARVALWQHFDDLVARLRMLRA